MVLDKKEKVLCTRVDDSMLEYIEDYSKKYNISTSKLIREAIAYYIQYAQKDENSIAPMILFAKGEFNYLMNQLNEEQIKELADSSYETALKGIKNYLERRTHEEFDPHGIRLRFLIRLIINAIFEYDSQNWLNDVSLISKVDSITIAGTHSFSMNFSIYLKYFIKKFFEPFSYVLKRENLKENVVHLIFTLEESITSSGK